MKAEQWTTSQVAEFFNLNSAASARSRIKRLGLQPVGRQLAHEGGEHLYDADQVRAGKDRMPGKGVGGGRPSKEKLLTTPEPPPAQPEIDNPARMDQWLAEHRRDLLAVGELLIDHREHLLGLLSDPGQQQQLAEAIDTAGELLNSQPRVGYAGAVVYAGYLLRPSGPARASGDPVVREGIAQGMRLRTSFDQVR